MKNLKAEMLRKGITVKDLQKLLKCSERTIKYRLSEKNDFAFPECVKIRDKFFPECKLEYLFAPDKTA